MNASISALCQRFLRRPLSEDESAVLRVRRELKGDERILPVRLAQAEARARRLVLANVDPDRAVHRAVIWARGALDSTSVSA